MTGLESLVVGVGAELLKSTVVAGLNFFRRKVKDDEKANHKVKDTLGETKANLGTALEEIIHGPLSSEIKDKMLSASNRAIIKLRKVRTRDLFCLICSSGCLTISILSQCDIFG
ncbi:MAG TPA: hypothetical protein G4O06_00045 [Dehalococcoidia bacterium]|nr:hypothetical protein [Dehalococcoidia bacterium]